MVIQLQQDRTLHKLEPFERSGIVSSWGYETAEVAAEWVVAMQQELTWELKELP